MKYIVMRAEVNDEMALELPIIFPDILVHADVAKCVGWMMQEQFKAPVKAISAGFLNSIEFDGICYGKSESLGLSSRGSVDEKLIKMCDYGGTIK